MGDFVKRYFLTLAVLLGTILFPSGVLAQAVPVDDTSIKLTSNHVGPDDTHLRVNYNKSAQGVNQSNQSYLKYDFSMFPSNLTGAAVQKATLILYVEESNTSNSGHVTVCQLGAAFDGNSTNGLNPPACKAGIAPVSFPVTASQLAEGSFIVVDITPLVQNWFNGQPNFGIGLLAEAPITGTGTGINVEFDSIRDNGNGYPSQIQVVLQSQGAQGIQGPQGVAGTNGTNGTNGLPGAASTVPGPMGPVGPASTVAGPKGDKGDTGLPGLPGAASTVAGPQGIQGVSGIPGLPGHDSTVAGPKGDTGLQGLPGAASTVAGPQGLQGLPGHDSTVAGPAGAVGAAGAAGVNGHDGVNGTNGTNGSNGTNGVDGKGFAFKGLYDPTQVYSLNDVVQFNGSSFTSRENNNGPNLATPDINPGQWLLAAQAGSKGDKGDAGHDGLSIIGPQGPQGATGAAGADGYTPLKNVNYFDGAQGIQGVAGAKGDTGAAGPAGNPSAVLTNLALTGTCVNGTLAIPSASGITIALTSGNPCDLVVTPYDGLTQVVIAGVVSTFGSSSNPAAFTVVQTSSTTATLYPTNASGTQVTGNLVISGTSNSGNVSQNVLVNVPPPPPIVTSITIIGATETNVSVPVTYTAQAYDQFNHPTSAVVSWNSDNAAVLTINNSGTINPLTPGSAHITASANGVSSNSIPVTVTAIGFFEGLWEFKSIVLNGSCFMFVEVDLHQTAGSPSITIANQHVANNGAIVGGLQAALLNTCNTGRMVFTPVDYLNNFSSGTNPSGQDFTLVFAGTQGGPVPDSYTMTLSGIRSVDSQTASGTMSCVDSNGTTQVACPWSGTFTGTHIHPFNSVLNVFSGGSIVPGGCSVDFTNGSLVNHDYVGVSACGQSVEQIGNFLHEAGVGVSDTYYLLNTIDTGAANPVASDITTLHQF